MNFYVRLIATVVLLGAALATTLLLVQRDGFVGLLDSVPAWGPWGPLVYGGVYTLAVVLLVPGSLLTMGAGFLFGIARGLITVSLASTLGAAAAFALGRGIARPWVQQWAHRDARFKAIEDAVKSNGFKIVFLLRLSPLFPFNLLNYALGLTSVSWRDYVLASWIGMLPGAVLYIYLGATLKSAAELAAGGQPRGTMSWLLFGVGLAATLAVTVILSRLARTALRRADVESPSTTRSFSAGEVQGRPK